MTEDLRSGRIRPLLSGLVRRSQTDERLALLASTGNQQAFSAIYERYKRELGSHARRIVRADRADDVVQHAMLAAWTALLGGAEIVDLRAWLHRVVHNTALDTVSRRGYGDSEIPVSTIAPARTDELAEGRLSAAAALAAIAALPGSQRRALTLTAVEGCTGHDAAIEMGISESAMRQLVYRARSGVRSALTAVTPLPLITRLVVAAGAPPDTGAVGLGAAGSGAAMIAKVVAVIGVAAATGVGATTALHGRHHPRHTQRTPTSHAPMLASESAGPAAALGARKSSGNGHSTLAARRHAGGQHEAGQSGSSAGDQTGSSAAGRSGASARDESGSSQHGSDNHTTRLSGSQRAGGRESPQSETQTQAPTTIGAGNAPFDTSNGSPSEPGGQANGETSSSQSGADRSPALQDRQFGGN